VSLHPNCQKHLKKKKKSTNVDAEYNLQTWVPRTRVNKTKRRIPGVEHSGNIQGTFREHSGKMQGTFRENSGNIQATYLSGRATMERRPRYDRWRSTNSSILPPLIVPTKMSACKHTWMVLGFLGFRGQGLVWVFRVFKA
jgi:hypothetical protein